jgi:hypothetical protein
MQLFGVTIWFWAWVATTLVLCFSLAHNITNGKQLRLALQAELVKLRAQAAAMWDSRNGNGANAVSSDPAASPNAASTGIGSSNRGNNA